MIVVLKTVSCCFRRLELGSCSYRFSRSPVMAWGSYERANCKDSNFDPLRTGLSVRLGNPTGRRSRLRRRASMSAPEVLTTVLLVLMIPGLLTYLPSRRRRDRSP